MCLKLEELKYVDQWNVSSFALGNQKFCGTSSKKCFFHVSDPLRHLCECTRRSYWPIHILDMRIYQYTQALMFKRIAWYFSSTHIHPVSHWFKRRADRTEEPPALTSSELSFIWADKLWSCHPLLGLSTPAFTESLSVTALADASRLLCSAKALKKN